MINILDFADCIIDSASLMKLAIKGSVNMVNEVEETLRCIHNDMSVHDYELNKLDVILTALKLHDIPEDLFKMISECVEFKKEFHKHKINELVDAKDEIIIKYDLKV